MKTLTLITLYLIFAAVVGLIAWSLVRINKDDD